MDLVFNLLCWLNTWPNRMVFRPDGVDYILPVHENFPSFLYISYILQNVFFHIQSLSSILICFHRLTTSIFKESNAFWNKYYLLVYALFIVYSICAVQLMIFNRVQFDYQLNAFRTTPLTEEQIFANRVYLRSFISGYLLILIVIGSITIFQVKKRLDNQTAQHQSLLRKMSQITISHSLIYALLLSWQIASPFLSFNNAVNILMTASDMVTFSMVYILLIFDGNVRSSITKKIPFTIMIRGRVSNSESGVQNHSSRVVVM